LLSAALRHSNIITLLHALLQHVHEKAEQTWLRVQYLYVYLHSHKPFLSEKETLQVFEVLCLEILMSDGIVMSSIKTQREVPLGSH
jgi:hypothetical protein